jgi:hypothetical protein
MRVSLRTILSRSRGLLLHRPRGERDRHEHNYLLGPVVPRTRGTASNSVGYKHPMVQRFTKISVQLGPTWGPDLPPRPGCVSQRFLSWRSGVLEAQPGYWLAEKEKAPGTPPQIAGTNPPQLPRASTEKKIPEAQIFPRYPPWNRRVPPLSPVLERGLAVCLQVRLPADGPFLFCAYLVGGPARPVGSRSPRAAGEIYLPATDRSHRRNHRPVELSMPRWMSGMPRAAPPQPWVGPVTSPRHPFRGS